MNSLSRNIIKLIKWPMMALLMAFSVSCQNDLVDTPIIPDTEEDALTVTASLCIPDMPTTITRGNKADTPGDGLKLTVMEFDLGASASQSFLSNIYQAELLNGETTQVLNNGIVQFKFTVKASTTPKVLHLMISNDFLTSPYGSEATIMPALTVGSTTSEPEAYWGRVEFPNGLTTLDEYGNPKLRDDVTTALTNLPVIRNFAKIVVSRASTATNFELLGFELVNVPTSGTLAPWDQSTLSIPNLLDGNSMKSYTDITNTVKYGGILPGSTYFRNTETTAKTWNDGDNSVLRSRLARYMYEHPYESTRRTYLIVNGNYNGEQGFYKVDIGKLNAANGTFDYYNILRNIEYNVVIQSVSAPGEKTVEAAIDKAPSNNLMAATETSSMLNVSDGANMLVVNDTNHIIVNENEKIDVLYQYFTGLDTGNRQQQNNIPHTVGLEKGDVIASFTEAVDSIDPTGGRWLRITITPNAPTGEVKTQDFSIVDGNGLGRTIHLVLRNPWSYANMAAEGATPIYAIVKSGTSDTYSSVTNDVISSAAQAPLTVYFNLPSGLPESMFPLEFQIESKNQGIENNKIGTMVVNSGASLFDDSKIAISYIKTVTYAEYSFNFASDHTTIDPNSSNDKHTIRCRFLTITAGADNDAAIRIHNPYFQPDATVNFTRN